MSAILKPVKWFYHEFGVAAIHETGRDAYLIIFARAARMFAYGTNSLILAIFFASLEFSDHQIGLFMTLTLLGDVILGTFLTLIADKVGRRKVLIGGSLLMVLSGAVFALFENFFILLLAAVVGVISVTGGDFGPFRTIEESVLSQLTNPTTRADVLAWYVTISALGSSLGSEASGRIVNYLQNLDGWTPNDTYHTLFWGYSIMGLLNALFMFLLSEACELQSSDTYTQVPQDDEPDQRTLNHPPTQPSPSQPRNRLYTALNFLTNTLSQISAPTRSTMYKLWILLALDSIADGMVPYSLTNYYMDQKFSPSKSTLGDVTSASYFLAAIGSTFAGPVARKIGLVKTMVFTHVPSSAAVLIFPAPPVFWATAGLLLVRAALNNMDQAPRSALIAAVVKPEERTAVMGITTMVRTLFATAGPTVTGWLAGEDRFWIAFVAAGVCRLVYDFGLYAVFVNIRLYEHEGGQRKRGEMVESRRRRTSGEVDEEEALEMGSLAGSEESEESGEWVGGGGGKGDGVGRVVGLQAPLGMERVRSRSPRRPPSRD